MYFDSLRSALLMDGHGVFVWTAYGLTLLVLLLLVLTPWRRRRRLLLQLRGQLRREQAQAQEQRAQPPSSEEIGNASGA
jgi:heme exporter protein D